MVAGLVVQTPFPNRGIFLPVPFRLHVPRPKENPDHPDATATENEQALEMVELSAEGFPDRRINVVADALYRGEPWRQLPDNATHTSRPPADAVLYPPAPPLTGRRGHPAWKGERLGKPADLAAGAARRTAKVDRHGVVETVQIAVVRCLWWGGPHRTPVRIVLVRDPDSAKATWTPPRR